jgi:hypothetical protein
MVDSTNEQTEAALRAQDERTQAWTAFGDMLTTLRTLVRQHRAGMHPGTALDALDALLTEHGYIETQKGKA